MNKPSEPMKVMKLCPDCAQLLVIRTNKLNESQFLGCSGYPECTHTEPLTEYMKLRMAGVKDMFEEAT